MFKIKFEDRKKMKVMQALQVQEGDPYEIVLCEYPSDMEQGKINLVFDLEQLPQIESSLQFMTHVQTMKLVGKTKQGEVKVKIDDILYIESFGNDIYAYTNSATIELPNKLYQLVEELEPFGFIRVGKSCIVNIAKVYAIKPHFNGKLTLTLDNEQVLEVNRTYVKLFKAYLKK